MIGAKALCIRLHKVEGFARVYDDTRCWLLLGTKKYDTIYDRIRYLLSQKSGITSIISHNYAKIIVDLYYSLPLGKTLTLHNVIILIKSVFNKDQNRCYYDIFSEKPSHQ